MCVMGGLPQDPPLHLISGGPTSADLGSIHALCAQVFYHVWGLPFIGSSHLEALRGPLFHRRGI